MGSRVCIKIYDMMYNGHLVKLPNSTLMQRVFLFISQAQSVSYNKYGHGMSLYTDRPRRTSINNLQINSSQLPHTNRMFNGVNFMAQTVVKCNLTQTPLFIFLPLHNT